MVSDHLNFSNIQFENSVSNTLQEDMQDILHILDILQDTQNFILATLKKY